VDRATRGHILKDLVKVPQWPAFIDFIKEKEDDFLRSVEMAEDNQNQANIARGKYRLAKDLLAFIDDDIQFALDQESNKQKD
jgi:hypothetical protein